MALAGGQPRSKHAPLAVGMGFEVVPEVPDREEGALRGGVGIEEGKVQDTIGNDGHEDVHGSGRL